MGAGSGFGLGSRKAGESGIKDKFVGGEVTDTLFWVRKSVCCLEGSVATCSLETISAFAYRRRKTKKMCVETAGRGTCSQQQFGKRKNVAALGVSLDFTHTHFVR